MAEKTFYSESFIKSNLRRNGINRKQIKILAELNGMSYNKFVYFLLKQEIIERKDLIKKGQNKRGIHVKDNVNHPKHYTLENMECIEVMEKTQGIQEVKSFCLCNAFKYLFRHKNKNGLEDIKKAKCYLDKYIELSEKKEGN